MRIDRVTLYHVAMPLIRPWRTAYGEDAAVHSLLCRLESGSFVGWGEAAPFAAPCYSAEWAGGAFAVAHQWLAPALLGQFVPTAESLQSRLACFKGNPFAKAALDTAWWSLRSRVTGVPLHTLLGAARAHASVGADFGVMDSLDELLAGVGAAAAEGFRRIKLKFRPGWDLPMLEAVRRQHPRQVFHVDCNSGYRLDDLPLLARLDDFNLAMIEQPLGHDDLVDHAELRRRVRTPVCLDESVASLHLARQALALGSCDFVNIKPGRVGGLTPAAAIHDICRASGVPCWVGGMLESAVGAAHCVALALLENCVYPADIFPSARFHHEDLADPPLELARDADGAPCVLPLAEHPEPNPARLARHTVRSVVLKG